MSRRDGAVRLGGFAGDREGVAAIEFAFMLPVLILLIVGTFQLGEALSAYRKVTLTAQTVVNLTSQYTSMASSDVSTVLNASAQVMAPFNTSSIAIVLTEFSTSVAGVTTVTWSQTLNGTALVAGTNATLPPGVALPGSSIVLASVSYTYVPVIHFGTSLFGSGLMSGNYTMSSQSYMFPRSTQSINYTGS